MLGWLMLTVGLMTMTDGGDDWRARVERAIAAHAAKYAGWKNHLPPPRVSFREFDLPEAVLAGCLEPKNGGSCPGHPSYYLDALAAKGTASSARVVFDGASARPYPSLAYALIAEHAPVETLLELQRRDPAKGTQSLAFALSRRQGMPEEARARLYEALRPQARRPENGEPESMWRALHALQPARARDELAGFLGDGGENLYVLRVLELEPRPERPAVREALLRNVKKAETTGWLSFNNTLLANLGDDAVPALDDWVERRLKANGATKESDLGGLLTRLLLHPSSPGVDRFKAKLARDPRMEEYARHQLVRVLEQSGYPEAAKLKGVARGEVTLRRHSKLSARSKSDAFEAAARATSSFTRPAR
jgi:hypothetical protein